VVSSTGVRPKQKIAKVLGLVRDLVVMETIATDAELLLRSISQPDVFGELYSRHGLNIRRYVVSRVGVASGEDLAAEVFIRAFRGRDKCRAENGTALPWLFGVANHVISDHRRVERRQLAALELAAKQNEVVARPDVGLTPEVVGALRRLPATDRDTLLLMVWGELSRTEIAAALGVPVGTVDSRISRARKRLASDLAPLHQTGAELQTSGGSNV
jgi:RNA polymerase sigma factor (sigma-70 family)